MQERQQQEEGLPLTKLKAVLEHPAQEWRIYLAALIYIDAGIYVLPVEENGKGLPRANYNINYGHASRSKSVIEKWFNPDTGTFAGWNIGIATGRTGGVFVVDVDRHGDEDGLFHLRRLEKKYGEMPHGPVQATPNDGFHYLLQWQEHASQSTGKLAPSIDTRGGDENACKGHINAFPSVVDGKMYEWVEGGPIPVTPKWITDKLGILWKPRQSGGRGNENVTDEDVERPIEKEQIISMLEAIDPNECSYDDWLKIGLSIKSQLNDQDGLSIWDAWSKRGARYEPRECEIRWNGFSDFGTVRGGTLFYYAKQGGWTPDRKKGERSGNPYEEIVAELNETYAVVSIGGKIRIIREKKVLQDKTMMHYDLMDKDSFTLLLHNRKIMSGGQKPKPVPVSAIWLAHEGRRTYENGMGLFPNNDEPAGYYNSWHGFAYEPIKGECGLFIKHIENVLCNGNTDLSEWLLDWCADLVQDPADPKGCAVVMRGGEGCGKGTFANTIGELFGPHHRHLIDESHLVSNFNSHLFDAVTVFADEITWGGNKKSAGKLKGMVTEKVLVGERKGIDAILYRNMVHLMIASNSDWVIPAGADSRRWFMLDVIGDKKGKVGYFNAINDELDNGGREALLYFLMNRKITHNLRKAPETAVLQEQRILSIQDNTVVSWWVQILLKENIVAIDVKDRDRNDGWAEHVNKADLHELYTNYCADKKQRAMGIALFCKEMIKYGISTERIAVDKERKYVFTLPPLEVCRSKINDAYEGIFGDDIQGDDSNKE